MNAARSSDAVPSGGHARTQIRGSTLLLIGRALSLVLSFIVQVVTVRYLAKTDYGAFAFALSAASMVTNFVLLGLDKAAPRFTSIYLEERAYPRLFGSMFLMLASIAGTGAAAILLTFGLQDLIAETFQINELALTLLLMMIVLAPVQALDAVLMSLFASLASPWSIFFRQYVVGPGLKLLVVIAVVLAAGDVRAIALGYVAGGALGVLLYGGLLVHLLRRQQLLTHFSMRSVSVPFREMFGLSLPLMSSNFGFVLTTSLAVLLLEYFHDNTNVAEFQAVLPFSRLNLVVMTSFSYLLMPVAARLYARHDREQIQDVYWQTVLWITALTLPALLLTFSLAQPLTVVLLGERYAGSGIILALLSLGFFAEAVTSADVQMLTVYGKGRPILALNACAAVVALATALWLIPAYAAVGAGVARCVTLGFRGLLAHLVLLRCTGIGLPSLQYARTFAAIGAVTAIFTGLCWYYRPPLVAGCLLIACLWML